MSVHTLSKKDYETYKTKAYFLARQLAPGYPCEELIGWGMVSLSKSLNQYVPDGKMCLHSYIMQNMKWDILDAIRIMRLESRDETKKGVTYHEVSIDDMEDLPEIPEVNADVLDLRRAVEKLPKLRRKYIKAYIEFDDREAAAKSLGISLDCGHQHHWQAIRSLRTILTDNRSSV